MKNWKTFFIQGIAVFLGFTFWGAGMVKLFSEHQFIGWIGPPWLVEEMAKYNLAFYATFIAYSQIFIGFSLLTTRYKLLGSIMMIPMIVNILMVTISLEWQGTPFVLAFLLLLDLILLWSYRDFFRPLLNEEIKVPSIKTRKPKTLNGHLVWLAGLGLQILAVPVSFWNWYAACTIVVAGLILAFLSFKADRINAG
ncbi:MAG: hypothetical protein PSV36_19410 [Algoriphagus sp.]|nr:hypothetical protein [Algoriphagus sp.]